MKRVLLYLLWLALPYPAFGGMPWPFEYHLRRAESIIIARVVACDGGPTITFRCTEQLRGKTDAEVSLSWGGLEPGATYFVLVGTEVLLLSQSTKEVPAKPIFDVPYYSGIGMARGLGRWISLPIKRVGKEACVHLPGGIDGAWPQGEPSAEISISRFKQLLDRFAYNPNAEIR